MSCLGVHFALSDVDVAALLAKPTDEERLIAITDDIEDRYFEEPRAYIAQSDKSWDAMHRALSNGFLTTDGGDYPLNHVVIGGSLIYGGDDYIMSLKTPSQVRDIASALTQLTEETFRKRYDSIDPEDYGFPLTDEDFQYTWGWFEDVRTLFQRAAAENRHVLFTADQ